MNETIGKFVVWSTCNCQRTHATHRELARCKYSRIPPQRISGTGPHVAVAWCTPASMTLWPTQNQARERITKDLARCGPTCDPTKHHLAKAILTT